MTPVTQDQIDAAAELLRPKGSQPADDVPVAVITVFRSSYVMAGVSPEFDLASTGHRRWFVDRCFQAAQAISGADPDETKNIVLTAPEVLSPLGDINDDTPFMASTLAAEDTTVPDRTHFEVYQGDDGWRWRLRAGNGEPIASGEAYTTKRAALHAVSLIADVDDETPVEPLLE